MAFCCERSNKMCLASAAREALQSSSAFDSSNARLGGAHAKLFQANPRQRRHTRRMLDCHADNVTVFVEINEHVCRNLTRLLDRTIGKLQQSCIGISEV